LTGQWLLDSDLYNTWQREPNSWTWYHGIPGCGKTVLNATVVRDLRERYAGHKDHAVIHFYFDCNDSGRNNLDFMLRSLLLQLNDKLDHLSQETSLLHARDCMNGKLDPDTHQLLCTLKTSLARFASVFILLDGLDESEGDAEDIYDSIATLHKWKLPCVHTFITSRRESDIFDCLEAIIPKECIFEISSEAVNKDIEIWLDAQLQSGRVGRKLSKWEQPGAIRKKIKDALMDRASGM
jgi:hypothetical protein